MRSECRSQFCCQVESASISLDWVLTDCVVTILRSNNDTPPLLMSMLVQYFLLFWICTPYLLFDYALVQMIGDAAAGGDLQNLFCPYLQSQGQPMSPCLVKGSLCNCKVCSAMTSCTLSPVLL